jgi:F-type H+-transporting ATPase subunit alpha
MPVEQQVMIIYAVTNGFLDDVAVGDVREWERGFHEFMHAQFPQVGDGIRTHKALSKEIEADLRRGIEAFKRFAAMNRRPGAPAAPQGEQQQQQPQQQEPQEQQRPAMAGAR